jgi:AhpD family alkylhydroperoxidase
MTMNNGIGKDFTTRYDDLRKLMADLGKESPAMMKAFNGLHHTTMADGELSTKLKELIALGMSIALRCDGCIAFHVPAALKAGATRGEILETIGVAVLMGGGPSMMYALDAYDALDEFEGADLG